MYPQYTKDTLPCQLPESAHTPCHPADLRFHLTYSTPTGFIHRDPEFRERMLSYYREGFPDWTRQAIDAWWRWFNRQPIGGS